jgi:two-component system, response regulator PdtaR
MGRGTAPISVLVVEDEVLVSNLVGAAIDVLFTDVNLPGGMNGAELAARAREIRPEMPIVYASGRYKLSEIAPLVPRSLFMAKPYDPNDVCAILTRLTGARSPS